MIESLKRCYGCYEELQQGIYHPKCSKDLFGTEIPPSMLTTAEELDAFADQFLKKRVTVTGVQKKLSMSIEGAQKNRLTVVGGLGGGYIMKPPSAEYKELPENEDLCMHLARVCGIKTAKHGLIPMKNGDLAYITKRFDRDKRKKIAVEDLCQLSGLSTERKYRSSYENIGKIIKKYASVPGNEALKFFEVVLFSFVTGNNDMHLKNFSLLTEDAKNIGLTPAYDLLSVRMVLSAKEDPEELALTLNGKKRKISKADFLSFGNQLSIPEKVVVRALEIQLKKRNEMETWIDKSFLSKEMKQDFKKKLDLTMGSIR